MMNKIAYDITGITEEQYRKWCAKNQLPHYKKETKIRFFRNIQSGKITKDSSGELVNKSYDI